MASSQERHVRGGLAASLGWSGSWVLLAASIHGGAGVVVTASSDAYVEASMEADQAEADLAVARAESEFRDSKDWTPMDPVHPKEWEIKRIADAFERAGKVVRPKYRALAAGNAKP